VARDEIHNAAKRIGPIQARTSPLDYFDSADGLARHAAPVDPAPERIVERDLIRQNNRAACAARANASKRNALRSRVGSAASGTSKQRETRHLTKSIVKRYCRGRR